jgi:geranylgeranyl diphosphate synthase type II
MRYSLLGGGKRIRPLLCIAGAESVGGRADAVLPAACALEMIHTFSLIHDDLPAIDDDNYRRGIPTAHRKYGEAMAILAGDALHTLAFAVVAAHQTADDPTRVIRVIALIADAAGTDGMVGGQVDDLYYERHAGVDADILRSIHARKTGALLNASILSGALLCGADERAERALRAYGGHVGVCFQIVDDVLDVTGDALKLGKPIGSDEKKGKATYPKLFGIDRSLRLARESSEAAVAALEALDHRAEPLRAFARFIVERDV